MSISSHAVFVWCFLMSVQMWIVPADTKTVVNYREMSTLVKNNKSVLVSGNEVELDSWLSQVQCSEDRVKGHDLNSMIMFTSLKCECAYYVNTIIVKSVRGIEISAAIPYLIKLNEEIKKALTIMFEISDEYGNVKSSEPYFLKTLLMISFYIDTFLGPSAPIQPDSEEPQNNNMDRVIMQIVNLVEFYALGNCNITLEIDINKKTLDVQLYEFRVFLEKIIYTTQTGDNRMSVEPYRLTNLSGIKFEICFTDMVKVNLFSFCEYLRLSEVTRRDGAKTNLSLFLRDVESKTFNSVESVYDYIFTIYKLVLKKVYILTVSFWDNNNSLDVDWCKGIISKLRLMSFPIAIIDHFEFVLRVERYRNEYAEIFSLLLDNAKQIVEARANGIDNVTPYMYASNLTLFSFMEAMLDNDLLQLWRVFNLLHKESGKTSPVLFENVIIDLMGENVKNETVIDCKPLTQVYRHCLDIDFKINSCLRPNENSVEYNSSITACLSDIRDVHLMEFSKFLLRQVEEWAELVFAHSDIYIDPIEIFMSAVTILTNESNTENGNAQSDFDQSQTNDSNTLITRKLLRLKRIVKYIMNIVNNYEIKNCEDLRNNRPEYIKMLENGEPSQSSSHAVNVSVIEREKILEQSQILAYSMGMSEDINSTSLGTGICFDWYGEIKSVREIHKDVMENVLDMHNLVDYHWIHLKWVIFLFYKTWFLIFENQIVDNIDDISKTNIFSAAIECLNEFNQMKLPEQCEKCADYYLTAEFLQLFIVIYEKDEHNDISGKIDLIRNEIICLMTERLGVVRETPIGITDVQHFFSIDRDDWNNINVFSTLLMNVKAILSIIDESSLFHPKL